MQGDPGSCSPGEPPGFEPSGFLMGFPGLMVVSKLVIFSWGSPPEQPRAIYRCCIGLPRGQARGLSKSSPGDSEGHTWSTSPDLNKQTDVIVYNI